MSNVRPLTKRRRQSTGKRLRFEVFKRDQFTCQYCGAQPPTVVLVVDHVTPVVSGGLTTLDNLLTSCEPCNQGKADRPLGDVVARPDADLMYLAVQQEVAELRRYQAALTDREDALSALIERLQTAWSAVTGYEWVPSSVFVRSLLSRYDPDVVGEAIENVAVKLAGGYLREEDGKWDRYLWAVARTMQREREGDDEAGS